MKESIVKDLIGGNLVRLVTTAVQGVYPDAYEGRALAAHGIHSIESPVAISQLACSPASQILSFLTMETDSMVRLGNRMLPGRPREESLKLVLSANAEILNFVSSRLAWLLSKLENSPLTEISPPEISNFSRDRAFRIRADEALCFEFTCAPQNLAFRFAAGIQSLP
jgi:hypothetical protein